MPSEKVLEQKKIIVDELAEKIKASCAGVLVDYKGINVADDTKLRKELREAGVEYKVVKNTLLKLAVDRCELSGLDDVLEGTTAIALSESDYVAAARILCKYADDHKDTFSVKLGFMDGAVMSKEEVTELSKIPPKETLIARVLGGLNSPITGLACVLNAIKEQKESA